MRPFGAHQHGIADLFDDSREGDACVASEAMMPGLRWWYQHLGGLPAWQGVRADETWGTANTMEKVHALLLMRAAKEGSGT